MTILKVVVRLWRISLNYVMNFFSWNLSIGLVEMPILLQVCVGAKPIHGNKQTVL